MLGKLVVILVVLISLGSAETIQVDGYNFTFEMNKNHIIDNDTIRTYYGFVNPVVVNGSGVYLRKEYVFIGTTNSRNEIFQIYERGGEDSDPQFFAIDASLFPNSTICVHSTMNLTDTIDFLKTLKVEKIK
ncbi:MAG: hypothetical protein ACE14P_14105 [Methanotrichaceae archaeon]